VVVGVKGHIRINKVLKAMNMLKGNGVFVVLIKQALVSMLLSICQCT